MTVNSATEMVATWSKGLPPVKEMPVVWFESNSSEEVYFAIFGFTKNALAGNDLIVTGSTSNLTCSFNGGCKLSMTSNGLATLLKNSGSYSVSVCENVCTYSDADSSSTQATCVLPKMPTLYSNTNFNISEWQEDLTSGEIYSNINAKDIFFDNELMEHTMTWGSTYVGMKFKEGHVAMISQVKWFLNSYNPDRMVGRTKF